MRSSRAPCRNANRLNSASKGCCQGWRLIEARPSASSRPLRPGPTSFSRSIGKSMKVPVNSIRAGNVLEYNGRLWVASKVTHVTPGKGGAFVTIEAKALKEGNKLQERFRSGETIEPVHIDERDCTYLFTDANG